MARPSTAPKTPSNKSSKAVILKLAEEAGRKAATKVAKKVAGKEAGRIAARVATKATLDPDYTLDNQTDFEDEIPEYNARGYGRDNEEEEDEENEDGLNTYSQFASAPAQDEDDLSDNPRSADIFNFGSTLLNKGTPIRFQIKKNGQFLTTIRKPYSEEKLQEDYGEGHYAVILRNDSKGTFIKQQSFSIAAPILRPEETVRAQQEDKVDKMFHTFSEMQQRTQEAQAAMAERLIEEQRYREEEEKERRREEKDMAREQEKQNQNLLATVLQASLQKPSDNGSSTAIMQMMQSSQQQTSQMIMESNKNFMTMLSEMRRDSQTMIEKIVTSQNDQARDFREQIARMAESGNKKESLDPIALFKMMNDTRDAGMNFGLKIQEMAKELAGDIDRPEKEPKGLTETIIENLGKLAPLMLAASQNNGPAPQQYFEQPSQALVPAPTQPSYKQRPVVPNPTQEAVRPVVRPVVAIPNQNAVIPKKTSVTNVAVVPESVKITPEVGAKQTVIDICAPLIGHALVNKASAAQLGEATIKALSDVKISASKAVEIVTLDDIFHLSFKVHGLPDVPELRAYLKDYHDYLRQKAPSSQLG
jgi:hypothetical protein